MTTYEILSLVVSASAVASIWFGIWQMRRAGDQRADREDARHAEAMTSLRALVAGLEQQGQGLREQGQALREMGQALREQGQALRQQGAALEAVLKDRA